jgi:hypothetical protein
MARDLCADVRMEEGYMRMSIEYNNDDSMEKIQKAINEVEKDMQLFPSVIRRAISEHAGNISVEFDTEWVQREAGEFCEAVLKKVGINHCGI